MKNNKMYFSCCRTKSISEENLHEVGRLRRPNPIIVGIANHLREHHSSTRNSAMAGCFGFRDSPPKYEDIYVVTTSPGGRQHRMEIGGVCNEDGTKTIMNEEGMTTSDEDELPPPSYKESVEMASGCIVVNVIIEQNQQTSDNAQKTFA